LIISYRLTFSIIGKADSRDTITIRPATNQALCPQNATYFLSHKVNSTIVYIIGTCKAVFRKKPAT
jgi:hypothetical protein